LTVLIEALEIALESDPRIRGLLAGRGGSDSPAVSERVTRPAARDRISLLGDRPDPETVLAAADVFALSSLREGASGATIEAMAVGVPVVATDVAGLRGITVDGVNARIVPPASPKRLAAGILEVLDDRPLAQRLGDGGRATFESRFTLEHATRSMAALYRSVAAEHGVATVEPITADRAPARPSAVRTTAARGVTRVLGSRPVSATWRRARPGLRILAYHGVTDRARFAEHLDMVVHSYTPVSGAEVVRARRNGASLPDDAVWITFDDGDKSVISEAKAALVERGVPATLFVCPGLVTERQPAWWTVVLAAGERGEGAVLDGVELEGQALVTALKDVPDNHRRDVVADLAQRLGDVEIDSLVTLDDIRAWQDAGLEIGNHTWDHPCLDQCPEDEQTRQIEIAHEWLSEHVGPPSCCSRTRTVIAPIMPRQCSGSSTTGRSCCSTTG
jgi:peptidoglycan/xylan/chitin deacetylase (PgdA/CDA1 family)